MILAGFVVLPVAPLFYFEWRRGKFRYRGTGIGPRNVITGFLGAILMALALQVITPPNLRLTSKFDPNSLTGRVVWNAHFELVVIALGFLVGLVLGSLGTTSRGRQDASTRSECTDPPSPAVARSAPVEAPPAVRACPHCESPMPRSSARCPHCRGSSPAWLLHEGTWWVAGSDGSWHWLDEAQRSWQKWEPIAVAPTG